MHCIGFWIKNNLSRESILKRIARQPEIHVPPHPSPLTSLQNIWHFKQKLGCAIDFSTFLNANVNFPAKKNVNVITQRWMNQTAKAHKGLVARLSTRPPSTWRNDGCSQSLRASFLLKNTVFFKGDWEPPKDNISWKKTEKVELCPQLHLSPSKL